MSKVTRSVSKDKSSEQAKKENSSRNPLSDDGDDSMADFKSPESKKLRGTSLPKVIQPTAKSKMKIELNLKSGHSNRKERKKKETCRSKKSASKSQPSIESSFFKAKDTATEENLSEDVKAGIVCALCFKVCKDEESQALHIKICAIKHKLSTKQLMDVMELQKRQGEERRSLGLLTGPALQERKKQTPRRAIKAESEDADLQLGLALSRSLREIEEANEFDDLDLHRESLGLANWNEKEAKIVPQLEKFGFASTGKPTATTKTRKRKLNEVTVLQTRSEADRNRILAERIAEILMGSDTVTQDFHENTTNQTLKKERMLRSYLLKTYHCTKADLWQASSLLPQQGHFYVDELSDYIAPCEESLANGDNEDIATSPSNSVQQSEDLESMETGETFGDQKRFYDISVRSPAVFTGEITDEKANDKFGNSLALDWARALNDSSASDMIINVSNGQQIWSHKLVFYIRCSNILLDAQTNEDSKIPSIKERIDWLDTPYEVALAFLEFIYCGRIEKYKSIVEEKSGLSGLRSMARKYRVQELFDYLRKSEPTSKEISSLRDDYNVEENSGDVAIASERFDMNSSVGLTNKKSSLNDTRMQKKDLISTVSLVVPDADLELTLPETPKNMILSVKRDSVESMKAKSIDGTLCNSIKSLREEGTLGHIGMSPDMFDDMEEATSFFTKNCGKNGQLEEITEDCSVDMLRPKVSSPVSINSRAKIPSNSPEKFCKNEGKNSFITTPNSTHPNRSKERHSCLKKQRSNLSLFIEKFQKENNKSDSDMDSDTSTIQNFEVKRTRNPFNLNPMDKSSIHSDFQCEDLVAQRAPIKKIGLDALEYNLSDADTEPYAPDSPSSLRSNDVAEKDSFEEEVLAQLELDFNLCTQKYSERQDEVDQNTSKCWKASSSVPSVKDEHIDLSQCDTDEEETSMYTRYKKRHLENSIADYRTMLRKRIDSLDSTHLETAGTDRSGNNTTAGEIEITTLSDSETKSSHVSLISTEREFPNPLKRSFSANRSGLSQKKCRHSESGSDTDILYPYSPAGSETRHLSGNCQDMSTAARTSALWTQQDDESICTAHAKGVMEDSSEEYRGNGMNNEIIRGGLVSPVILTTPRLQSPVWVHSSPEMNLQEMDKRGGDTISRGKSNQSYDDDMEDIFEEIYLANVRVDDDVRSEPPSPLNKSKSDGLIGYCSAKLHTSLESTFEPTDGKGKRTDLNLSATRGKDALASERLSVRKLKRKSASQGNFTASRRSVSTPNFISCKCYRERMSELSLHAARTEQSTTPPPDFQSMDTPKLHKELNKYGLKLQKRKRAVKLLTHIYNELHPIVPLGEGNSVLRSTNDESEDDSLLEKRREHLDSSSQSKERNLSEDYSIADMPTSDIVIAEEREIDEIDPVNTDIGSNVKEEFLKLIKANRELHNKILSYEPLCLEALHSSLKAEGLKCNKNMLMDFLDEQCITFYMQDNNRRIKPRGSKESRRKKTGK